MSLGFSVFAQDAPSGYTSYYSFRKWAENANPGSDSLNANWDEIDQVLYDLIVYTDTSQMFIRNDSLLFADEASGQDAFVTTAEFDTVLVPGVDSLDVIVVSAREAVPAPEDILGVYLKADTLIVGRTAAGTSGLKYNWIWIRKYQ
jgi:hypothetical protein